MRCFPTSNSAKSSTCSNWSASVWLCLCLIAGLNTYNLSNTYGQEPPAGASIPLTTEEFQKRVKSKELGPFIAELDKTLVKTPNEPNLLGIELQVAQYLLLNDRKTGMERFRSWVDKLSKLPRSTTMDKLFVAGIFNATVVQDPALAKEFISWIDLATQRIPSDEIVTQANINGNRLSLLALVDEKSQVESAFGQFFSNLETQLSEKKIPVAVLASQAMRYKSLFWSTNRDEAVRKIKVARQAYVKYFAEPNITPTDVLTYIQFMTTLANEISKELPREAFGALTELNEQLKIVQPKLPEEQRNGLNTTIVNIEQGLKQLDLALRQLDLIGKPAPAIADALYIDVPEEMQKELKGKAILLVFWAAWSEPCLKSLERIEKIRSGYPEQELSVIGVTKWYGMVWDEANKSVDRQADVTKEAELKALRSISEHHGCKFGIAAIPEESDLYQKYLVTGIPQLVLIEPEGNIKLIKPGLNEVQFKAIESEIESLLKK